MEIRITRGTSGWCIEHSNDDGESHEIHYFSNFADVVDWLESAEL